MPAKKNTEVATTQPKRSLIAKMAEERGVEASDFYETVTQTMFKGANKAQLMTLLLVADRYRLDVTTKEIFAFPDKSGGIVPVVSIDGWISLAHQHPQYDGEEIRWADKWVQPEGGKRCPEWCEIVIYRKDTGHPTVIREYLDECYRATPTWKSHTKRMLRHKTMIQGYRVAFGFSGIKDEDEAQRISVEGADVQGPARASSVAAAAREALGATPTPPEASEPPEVAYEPLTGEVIDIPEDVAELDDQAVGSYVLAKQDEIQVQALNEKLEEQPAEPRATKQQVAAIKAAKRNNEWSDEGYDLLLAEYGVSDPTELSRSDALEIVRHLMAGEDAEGQEEMEV